MNLISRLRLAAPLLAAVLLPALAQAQLNNDWIGTGTETWNDGTNWSAGVLPDVGFDEYANINGNASIFVDSAITPNPGEIRLGQGSGANNVLEIRDMGNLRVELTLIGGATNGGLHIGGFVGVGNTGTVRVLPGGTLTVDALLDTAADAGNVVSIGALAGAGTATVNTAAATLLGTTRFFANGDLNTTGNLLLGTSGSYTYVINPAQNSTATSGAQASIAGPLVLDFNGFTPTAGQTWSLIEAVDVTGSFSGISTPDTLGAGHKLTVEDRADHRRRTGRGDRFAGVRVERQSRHGSRLVEQSQYARYLHGRLFDTLRQRQA